MGISGRAQARTGGGDMQAVYKVEGAGIGAGTGRDEEPVEDWIRGEGAGERKGGSVWVVCSED